MRKTPIMILAALAFILISGCEQNPLASSDEKPLTYQNMVVQDTPAPFLLNNTLSGVRAKGSAASVVIKDNPAPGTVYGHQDYPGAVYQAHGNEELPIGSWVDNAYGNDYRIQLNAGISASFGDGRTVVVYKAKDLKYEDASGKWHELKKPGTIFAKTIVAKGGHKGLGRSMTGEDGSGEIGSDGPVSFGGPPINN
jgi:hypothetical protein